MGSGKIWNEQENKKHVRALIGTSKNSVIGNDQKSTFFYETVHQLFVEIAMEQKTSLRGKVLSSKCSKYSKIVLWFQCRCTKVWYGNAHGSRLYTNKSHWQLSSFSGCGGSYKQSSWHEPRFQILQPKQLVGIQSRDSKWVEKNTVFHHPAEHFAVFKEVQLRTLHVRGVLCKSKSAVIWELSDHWQVLEQKWEEIQHSTVKTEKTMSFLPGLLLK